MDVLQARTFRQEYTPIEQSAYRTLRRNFFKFKVVHVGRDRKWRVRSVDMGLLQGVRSLFGERRLIHQVLTSFKCDALVIQVTMVLARDDITAALAIVLVGSNPRTNSVLVPIDVDMLFTERQLAGLFGRVVSGDTQAHCPAHKEGNVRGVFEALADVLQAEHLRERGFRLQQVLSPRPADLGFDDMDAYVRFLAENVDERGVVSKRLHGMLKALQNASHEPAPPAVADRSRDGHERSAVLVKCLEDALSCSTEKERGRVRRRLRKHAGADVYRTLVADDGHLVLSAVAAMLKDLAETQSHNL